mmetsp:Transcript_31127/g.59158  ORF Transcript_31127/g.59158 Transcript_31127/m.59158 type:complete len:308 (+) Transcript_31127:274-1197(+)
MSKNNAEGEDVVLSSRMGGRGDYSSNAAAVIAGGDRSDGRSVAAAAAVASSAGDNIGPMLSSTDNYTAARAGNLNISLSLDGDPSTHTPSQPNMHHPLHHAHNAAPMTNRSSNNYNYNHCQNNSLSKLFESTHESFLEKLAREECRHLPCREHRSASATNGADRRRRNSFDEEEERRIEEGRRFMLLEFSSDDEDVSSDSEDDLSSSEEELEEVGDGSDHGNGMSDGDGAGGAHMDDEETNNDEPGDGRHIRENARVYDVEADHSIRYDDDEDNNNNNINSSINISINNTLHSASLLNHQSFFFLFR